MQPCSPDFQPIITAIALLLSAQVPILVAMFVNQWKIKHDVAVNKSLSYLIDKKTDIQTVVLTNGFHGPKGDKGDQGEPGLPAAEVKTEEK